MKIYKLNELDRYEKFFLYVLKDMGADQEPVTLTFDQLGDLIGASRGTVNKAIKNLENFGHIEIIKGLGRAANSYRITL